MVKAMEVPFTARGKLADSLYLLHRQGPPVFMLKPCSPQVTPSQWPSSGAALEPGTWPRMERLYQATFALGFPLAWDFPRAARSSQALPSRSFIFPPLQVSGLHHVWWIFLTIPDSSPLYFHSYFLATNPLYFGFHHSVCFLENLKLHRHFLSIPLFICVLCTPATQFSLDVVLEHHLIVFVWPTRS